jgi:hypothetical protein
MAMGSNAIILFVVLLNEACLSKSKFLREDVNKHELRVKRPENDFDFAILGNEKVL